MTYFQINELIQWITPFVHKDLKIKNQEYWIEINGYFSKWSIKIELNGEIRLFKSEINEHNAYDELILKIIENLNDKKLILFWNDYDNYGYLLKSTHDYNGLMNALIQNDFRLKTEIRNLREYIDYLERNFKNKKEE